MLVKNRQIKQLTERVEELTEAVNALTDFISKLHDWLEDLAEVIDDITGEGWDEYYEERSEFDEHLNPVNKRDSQLPEKDDD